MEMIMQNYKNNRWSDDVRIIRKGKNRKYQV
uniref:Putative LOC100891306 [Strongylocentrotus purpuratus] n=1 Tax=Lepeophtheirus salmonis TaxID=72036 RepID=A0A0K2UUH1_LEPSM